MDQTTATATATAIITQAERQLLSELDLGSARGGKAGTRERLEIEVSRALTSADLPAIQAPPVVAAQQVSLNTLRHSHHRLAELIVKGTPAGEISLILGYSIAYISNIQNDPAFAELLAYYESQKKTIFVDEMERLRVLGVDAMEKLHEQLHDPRKAWTPGQLMELIDMAVVSPNTTKQRPMQGAGSGNSQSLSLEVKFVGAEPRVSGPIIDASFTESNTKQ